jgi:KDO2-lipid IV(A) lauroyltransferase
MRYLLYGVMRLLSMVPLRALRMLGHGLGLLIWCFAVSRRHIAQTNLRLCFPQKSVSEIDHIVRNHFVNLGQSLMDRAWLWHAPLDTVKTRLHWLASPLSQAQLDADEPLIIFAPHFVGLDAGGLAFATRIERNAAFIFVPQHNKLMDEWVNQGRQRTSNVKPYFRHEGVKHILAGLRRGELLHLSPDMDFGPAESIFVPFMGVTAATVPSLSRFARLGRAKVMTAVTRMTPQGYEIELQAAWDNFPTDDVAADTLRMNDVLAKAIERSPAQYYWVHKRFKTRPEGEASVYKNADISR